MKSYCKICVFFLLILFVSLTAISRYKDAHSNSKSINTHSTQSAEKVQNQLQQVGKGRDMKLNELTPEEAYIIISKGTEMPYTGELLNNKAEGVYACRQCDSPLYFSYDKFDSQCGWPSFDDAVPGAVLRVPDSDGHRTEIICSNCAGHLGHVFEGEGFTEKNVRHCVNSLSMKFLPFNENQKTYPKTAFFGGGCFWGVEDGFSKIEGVLDVVSGYMGGASIFPTYEQVSKGDTGHAEVVKILYDPAIVDYETLARFFFEVHDPTQLNRQGPDFGTQYRSVIYYTDKSQEEIALKLKKLLIDKNYKVVTEISPAPAFFAAEDYHQDFTARTGRGACHLPVKRFDNPKPL